MTVESFEAQNTDPTAGANAGAPGTEQTQPTQGQPAARTFTKAEVDAQFADARRSWEYQAEQRLAKERQSWQQQAQPAAVQSDDPWSALDPQVAAAFRKIFDRELEARTKPLTEKLSAYEVRQDDISFANDEARVKAQYKDYEPNRRAILEYGAARRIADPETAYHAWRSTTQWKDPEVIGKQYLAEYQKRKSTSSASVPLAEGRGGGSPSTRTSFRNKDGSLDKDAMDAHALEILRAAE